MDSSRCKMTGSGGWGCITLHGAMRGLGLGFACDRVQTPPNRRKYNHTGGNTPEPICRLAQTGETTTGYCDAFVPKPYKA